MRGREGRIHTNCADAKHGADHLDAVSWGLAFLARRTHGICGITAYSHQVHADMAAHVDLGSHGTVVVLPVVGLRSCSSERENTEHGAEVGSPHVVYSGVSVEEEEGEESER